MLVPPSMPTGQSAEYTIQVPALTTYLVSFCTIPFSICKVLLFTPYLLPKIHPVGRDMDG